MSPRASLVLLLFAVCRTGSAAEFTFDDQTLTVPDGYVVERAAASPLVDRPITMAFEETGALYVADSSGSNEKPDVQWKNPTHRIVRLVDRDGDGVFDARTVFADKLAFPEGTMWLDGSLYAAIPPQIWRFTDTNADGIADQREVWFDGKTLTGCANDLHGPYAGPDGFIYWCKGAFAEQKHALADGRNFVTRAAHVFRARPDGSGLDVVMTGGMDNPVDVAFNNVGEMFVSGTFFVQPAGGKRDGVLHAVHGGVWGKQHGVIDGHPRTGDLMPVMTHLGPAAPSGLEMLRSDALGLRGDLVCCQFNLRKVSRHVLAPAGASYRTADSDLLVSDQPDFHPTDVIEDADGSLLIADTGGWYRLCCPTSTLAKPAVLGAIYRVRKRDAPGIADPRGLRMHGDVPEATVLAERLADARPAVVDRTMATLAKRGEVGALQAAYAKGEVRVRLLAIQTLARIPTDPARAAVRDALDDGDSAVRMLAANTVALWRDQRAFDPLVSLLGDPDSNLRRSAGAALGRLGDRRAIPHLLKAGEATRADRFLDHALAYALYEIGDDASLAAEDAGDLAQTASKMIAKRGTVKAMAPIPLAPAVGPAPPTDPAVIRQQRARLDELAAHLRNADAGRGAEVYRSGKALCTSCHAMANVGGTLGPDLTKIGAVRTERDLIEAIVHPSASFVRSYEPVLVRTKKQGDQLGILKNHGPDEVVLANGPGTEVRLARSDVLRMESATISLMPPGFDGILTPQELADLVAFLRTAK